MECNTRWARFAQGDADARQDLLNEHLGLVYFVARQVAANLAVPVEYDELVSAGTMGLMSALEGFDPGRGLALSTFAAPRIRGAVLDELRRQDRVPRSVRRKARLINAAAESLGQRHVAAATEAELAAELDVDVATLWRWQSDLEGAVSVSLDQSIDADDDLAPSKGETLVADDSDDVVEKLGLEQEVSFLSAAIEELSSPERTVLALHYYEDLKLREIATTLNLTESRVSQIRAKALKSLRTKLAPLRQHVA